MSSLIVNPSTVDAVRQMVDSVSSDPTKLATFDLHQLAQLFFSAGAASRGIQVTERTEKTDKIDIDSHREENMNFTRCQTNETICKTADGTETIHRKIDNIQSTVSKKSQQRVSYTRKECIDKKVEHMQKMLEDQTQQSLTHLRETTHFQRLFRQEIEDAELRLASAPACTDWIKEWLLQKRRPTTHDLITCSLDRLVLILKRHGVFKWLQDKNIVLDKLLLGKDILTLVCINHAEPVIRTPTGDKTYKASQMWNCTFIIHSSEPFKISISLPRMLVTHLWPSASRMFMEVVDIPSRLRQFRTSLENEQSDDEDQDKDPENDLDEEENYMANLPQDHVFKVGK